MCSLVNWADRPTAFLLCRAVVRELLYNIYKEATRYHVVAESQSAEVIVNKTIPRRWPSIETTRINVTCLLVYQGIPYIYTEMSRDVTTQISVCVDWSGMSISSYDLLKM